VHVYPDGGWTDPPSVWHSQFGFGHGGISWRCLAPPLPPELMYPTESGYSAARWVGTRRQAICRGDLYNPATQELFVGTVESGLLLNGKSASPLADDAAGGVRSCAAVVLAKSRVGNGISFRRKGFGVRQRGSVAYKLRALPPDWRRNLDAEADTS